MAKPNRKTYTPEFMASVVAQLGQKKISELAEEFNLHHTVIRRWANKAMEKPQAPKAMEKPQAPKAPPAEPVVELSPTGRVLKAIPPNVQRGLDMIAQGSTIAAAAKVAGMSTAMMGYYRKREERGSAHVNPTGTGKNRTISACIALLRGVRKSVNVDDPVHLTAMLVLATLEGKM